MMDVLQKLAKDTIFYFFVVAVSVELTWRLQNVLTRLANCNRTWDTVCKSLNSEFEAFKMETLNGCSSVIPLKDPLYYGTLIQIILIYSCGEPYPSLINIAIMVILFSVTWYFRSPRQGMGYALAWSYYFGYLRIMLPELMRHQRRYKGKDIAGFFILLPADCNVYDKIAEHDPRMKHVGNAEPIKRDVGGQIGRQYEHSVYEVCDSRGESSFLAYVEYPTPIKHFAIMSIEPYSSYMHFSEAERQYQLQAFGSTLETILRDRAPLDIPEASGKSIEQFFQIVHFDGDRNKIAATIGAKEWNMAGHAGPIENQRERRSPYDAQESIDETHMRHILDD